MQGIPALSSSRRLKARIILSSPHDSPAGGYQQEWPQPWAIPATTRADYSAKGEPEQVMCSNGLTLLRVLVGATDPNFRPEKLPYVDPSCASSHAGVWAPGQPHSPPHSQASETTCGWP